MSITSWLKQGSTAAGLVTLGGTAIAALATNLVTDHSALGIITAIGGFIMAVWPEGKSYIGTTETLLAHLEPIVVDAWPYIEKAIAEYQADRPMVVTATAST